MPKCFIVFGLVLLYTSGGHAQTVPPGLLLWLRADTGVVLESGHVAIWKDQSGKGNDVRMTDTSSRPDPGTVAINGHSSIVFHGLNFLEGPNIFPAEHDYSIAVVASITNSSKLNNLVSGSNHALWLNSDLYPRMLHYSFSHQEIAAVPMWPSSPSTVLGLFSSADNQAKLFVNGEFADSSYLDDCKDSTLLIGSYQRGYFLDGEIQEVMLFDRELSPPEVAALDSYLRARYNIAHGIPAPRPDSTFSVVPKKLELYPRGADDSASIPVVGTLFRPGFDSAYVLLYKNGKVISRLPSALSYTGNSAKLTFTPRIHAELSEYRIEVHVKSSFLDSVVALADSIVCGDAFLIDGQSNAVYGYEVDTFRNEYCRTFGQHYSQNKRDTTWDRAIAFKWGDNNSVGAWGQRIQRNLLEKAGIPSCCINGSQSGTGILSHERDSSNKYDLRTVYGRLLFRATQAHVLEGIHAVYWDQGELNYADGYYDNFVRLYRSWKEDYPNLQKVYLTQNRPNYCGWGNIDLRDVQRMIPASIPGVEAISTGNIAGQDGCHFHDRGYDALGDRLFASLARDFYNATDTNDLRSPNAIYAYYTDPSHTRIAILFTPRGVQLSSTSDTIVAGKLQTLKDYLYPDDTTSHVGSLSFSRDTLFINLEHASNAQSIGYLPDQYYNGTDSIYEGPWIVNSRGIGALLWHHLPISNTPMAVSSSQEVITTSEIYPNPATRSIRINAGELSPPITIKFVSESGDLVRTAKLTTSEGNTLVIDCEGLAPGTYMLELSDLTGRIVKKLVIRPQ